jgi:hypothetical protein
MIRYGKMGIEVYFLGRAIVASKSYASYQTEPKGDQQCDKCTMWRTPDRCSLVDGKISPQGWCKYFEAKKEPKQ